MIIDAVFSAGKHWVIKANSLPLKQRQGQLYYYFTNTDVLSIVIVIIIQILLHAGEIHRLLCSI